MNHVYTGLPLNDDGTVTLYYHTDRAGAALVRHMGRLKSEGVPLVVVSTRHLPTRCSANVVVAVKVFPESLILMEIFPDGHRDYSIYTGGPEGEIPIKIAAPLDAAVLAVIDFFRRQLYLASGEQK